MLISHEQPESREPSFGQHFIRRLLVQLTHLQLNLRLSNVLLASAAVGNLGGLGNLVPDSIGAEVLKRVTLGRVDAHGRVGLDSRKSSGNYNPSAHLIPSTLIQATHGRTAWHHQTPQRPQPDQASAARSRERGWREHPSRQTPRGC